MYQAIGCISKTVYMSGETPADIIRGLQAAYPKPANGVRSFKGSANNYYAEPLQIIDLTGQDKQYSL